MEYTADMTASKLNLKLESILDLTDELSKIALKCPTCRDLFREVIQLYKNNKVNHHVGGLSEKYGSSSLEATNHHEASSRVDLIDTFDIRRK
jgi:hypothetical protein